jgi:hypothetical protein
MANDIGDVGLLSPARSLAEPLNTRQFDSALDDAEVLLAYAASKGLLPSGKPDHVVEGIVQARQAPQITAQVATNFWTAYAHLARLVKPVTAASVRACQAASLLKEKLWAVVLVFIIIVFSIFLFMNNHTAQDTADLIDQQNAAALQLWQNLQIIHSTAPGGSQSSANAQNVAVFSTHVFEDTVEFSRKSQWLLQSASRLHFWFNPWWTNIDIQAVTFNDQNPDVNHLLVSPALSTPDEVSAEIVNQIKAYQQIRNYALSLYKTDSIIYGGITTYLLPTFYALLGAYLYGFRLYSRLMRRSTYLPSAAHSARFYIAAIAGLVVGLFGSLLPKSLSLSPLAVAFLVGYAVEAFFSWLDDVIAKLKTAASREKSAPQEEASGD